MRSRSKHNLTVLLLADRRRSPLKRFLSRDYEVMETFTTDRAVAVCVNNSVDVVVLDQDLFIETDGWSVAQSLKSAKPRLYVLLAMRANQLSKRKPKGVDAIVSAEDPNDVIAEINRLAGAA